MEHIVTLTTLTYGGDAMGRLDDNRAVSALEFGLGIHQIGFNIYVAGPPGMGKMTAVHTYLQKVARKNGAKRKLPVHFESGVIEKLPFEDGIFDVVLNRLMFHHLPGDLKQRGLLDDTLVIWGGEFGRTPTSEGVGRPGRDHRASEMDRQGLGHRSTLR